MMSEIKALDKLRKNLKDCTTEAGVEPNKFDTYWITADACDKLINDVEAEIADNYMRLPVDADGVLIHMGDTVEGELLFGNATVKGTVTTYHIHDNDEPDTVYIKVDCGNDTWTIKELRIERCRHVKPRTLEDVLNDRINDVLHVMTSGIGIALETALNDSFGEECADEIRELLGGDAE